MKLIAQLKLHPTSEHAHALRETLHTANAVCNQISTIAWESKTFKQFPLHRLVYSVFNDILPSNILVRCIAKVADAYKLDKNTKRVFRPTGALAYNDRTLSWNLKGSEVSILTRNGRIKVPFACGERQRQLLETRHGESDLVSINGQWYLFATCDVDDPTPADVDDALGVDVGIVNLATDSDGETYSGEQVEQKRQWYTNRRQTLQKVGTLSSKRRLRKLAGRQRRFQKNTNHVMSKRLVAKAKRTTRAIALEDLSGIRARARVKGPQQRARHSNWAFGQLRGCIDYKAQRAGVPVVVVDPAYTSQRCSACGHTERRNRKSQAAFCCVVCHHQLPADYNAAKNIQWAAANQPMVSETDSSVAPETSRCLEACGD